jgi:hypothetical protein
MSGIARKGVFLAICGAHPEGSRRSSSCRGSRTRRREAIGNRQRALASLWPWSRHSSRMPMAELSIGLNPRRR